MVHGCSLRNVSVHLITPGFATNSSFEEPRPSLPPRRPVKATGHGYENLPEKPIPPREPTGVGYINLPSKSERSGSDPPELPPRSPRAHTLGYENVPSSGRTLPPSSSSYQNILPSGMFGCYVLFGLQVFKNRGLTISLG